MTLIFAKKARICVFRINLDTGLIFSKIKYLSNMLVVTTVGIPPDTYELTVKHKVNRSKVCRDALAKECERLEKEVREIAAKQNPGPANTPQNALSYRSV